MTAAEIESRCATPVATLGTGTNEEIMKEVSLGTKSKQSQ